MTYNLEIPGQFSMNPLKRRQRIFIDVLLISK